MKLREGSWNLDEEHFEIAQRFMQENGIELGSLPVEDALDQVLWERCWAIGDAATLTLSDNEVVALFLKSDWDAVQGDGVHTNEGRMTLMRQTVSSNIADAVNQLALTM